MVEVQALLYNNQTVDDGEANYAFFDSSYGGIHLPYSEFDTLSQIFEKNMNALQCNKSEGEKKCWYYGKCQTNN